MLTFRRSTCRYESVAAEQAALRMRIRDLAQARVTYGYRCIHVLLKREGWQVNHKRVYRLYCLEGLRMRPKRPRRHVSSRRREIRPLASRPDERWAMDFMSDELFDGRRTCILTLVDHFTRESLAIEVDGRLGVQRLVEVLARLALQGRRPRTIAMDNGPRVHVKASGPVGVPERCGVGLQPARQAYGQCYDRSLQCQASGGMPQRKLVLVFGGCPGENRRWRRHYNGERLYGALGNLAPEAFALVASAGVQ